MDAFDTIFLRRSPHDSSPNTETETDGFCHRCLARPRSRMQESLPGTDMHAHATIHENQKPPVSYTSIPHFHWCPCFNHPHSCAQPRLAQTSKVHAATRLPPVTSYCDVNLRAASPSVVCQLWPALSWLWASCHEFVALRCLWT